MPTKKYLVPALDSEGKPAKDEKGNVVKVDSGRTYEIVKGRQFVWHADVWEDEGEEPFDISIPLRVKLKVLYAMDDVEMTPAAMRDLLAGIVPDQSDALGELDVNDLQAMFTTWQAEYSMLAGATPGE